MTPTIQLQLLLATFAGWVGLHQLTCPPQLGPMLVSDLAHSVPDPPCFRPEQWSLVSDPETVPALQRGHSFRLRQAETDAQEPHAFNSDRIRPVPPKTEDPASHGDGGPVNRRTISSHPGYLAPAPCANIIETLGLPELV